MYSMSAGHRCIGVEVLLLFGVWRKLFCFQIDGKLHFIVKNVVWNSDMDQGTEFGGKRVTVCEVGDTREPNNRTATGKMRICGLPQ